MSTMLYRAVHATRYRYQAVVSQCQTQVMLTPRALPWQTVLESKIETVPKPAWISERRDYFGNHVTTFSIVETHDRFSTVATSRVRVDPRPATAVPEISWESARREVAAHETSDLLEAFEFAFDSPFVAAAPELANYAKPSFAAGRPLLSAAEDLSHRIHTDFAYKPTSTAINTPLLDTLKAKRGVCQDFSHVMIGALRSLGLPARYVSGYLRSGADHKGAEASHAWVAVFVPGAGWIDLDPTNDVRAGTNHVTIGWGRDYGDVTPIRGVALGGGKQIVDVAVRVDPVGPEGPAEPWVPSTSRSA
jgi:transglutaminase-like putative cysteine protease